MTLLWGERPTIPNTAFPQGPTPKPGGGQPPWGPVPAHLLQDMSLAGLAKVAPSGAPPQTFRARSPSSRWSGCSLNQDPQSEQWWSAQSPLHAFSLSGVDIQHSHRSHHGAPMPPLCEIRTQVGICHFYEQDNRNIKSITPPLLRSHPVPAMSPWSFAHPPSVSSTASG